MQKRDFASGHALALKTYYTQDVAGIMFVLEAESDNPRFDETTMLEHADFFIEWDEHYTGKRGSIVRDGDGLFKALHDVGAGQAHFKPSESPTLWKPIGNPGEEYPAWSQPIAGVDNFYRIGDKVTHNGKRWICSQENTPQGNSYAPGTWGWTEVTA